MKAIIGRKLGMTQLFTEDGELVPVTVIAAGPCPVVAVRSQAEDGYDAVQLAFEEVPAKRLNKPETGHLAKVGIAPHRHLREFHGTTELTVGESVTVDVFGPGDHIKVTGTSIGKGFAGTIKRHNFGRGPESHGSHNVRKPGSIGQSAQPSRVFKGVRMSGPHGRRARDPARPGRDRSRLDAQRHPRLRLRAGLQGRARRDPGGRALMALTARILGGKKTAKLDESVFALEVNEPLLHEAVKAEGAAKRQGTHATKTRGQVAGGRSKPWRQKGTGRARQGTTRAAHWRGGGAVFGPHPRSYHLKMNRKAYRRARAIALSVHASRGTLAAFDAAAFSAPRTKDAIALLGDLDARPLVVVVTEEQANAALSFRNLERAVVLTADELEVTATLWARQLLVSTDALEVLTARLQPEPKVRQEVAA